LRALEPAPAPASQHAQTPEDPARGFALSGSQSVLLVGIKDAEVGRGCSVDNLTRMRRFYRCSRDRSPISETPSRIFAAPGIGALQRATPGANIHAREYVLALPSAEALRRKLLEWTEAR
jgi:hypothetical protein